MINNIKVNGEAMNDSVKNTLVVEQFLEDNYQFRRNVLNGKVEYRTCSTTIQDNEAPTQSEPEWMVLTQQAMNSIVIRAKREGICEKGSPKADIMELLNSNEVPAYDPIRDYLEHLPQWDGHNYVADVFGRLPGLTSEQLGFLSVWLRSTVAHWLQMDTLHGNECVPTLIGAQGCGKTTFLRRLLPAELRQYYLDHMNLSNKFDKEMALTNNLLVNLDELDAIRPSQHAELKQTLSKSKVNGRPIYGASQEDRPRYASFVATTNNPHPLTDATGSRRYICLTIPQGLFINNTGDISYDQLYAQVLYELREQQAPYWFNNDEVARIQQMNINYMEEKDIAEVVETCFRKPAEGEDAELMNTSQMIKHVQRDYPTIKNTHSTKVQLGLAMKELGYDVKQRGNVRHYRVVPLQKAC